MIFTETIGRSLIGDEVKLSEIQFESDEDREAAALLIIKIRERQPEPQAVAPKPLMMVWDTEQEAFEAELLKQGIRYRVDHSTEIHNASSSTSLTL